MVDNKEFKLSCVVHEVQALRDIIECNFGGEIISHLSDLRKLFQKHQRLCINQVNEPDFKRVHLDDNIHKIEYTLSRLNAFFEGALKVELQEDPRGRTAKLIIKPHSKSNFEKEIYELLNL